MDIVIVNLIQTIFQNLVSKLDVNKLHEILRTTCVLQIKCKTLKLHLCVLNSFKERVWYNSAISSVFLKWKTGRFFQMNINTVYYTGEERLNLFSVKSGENSLPNGLLPPRMHVFLSLVRNYKSYKFSHCILSRKTLLLLIYITFRKWLIFK